MLVHPAPEVPCRTARPEETPRTAVALATRAAAHGWSVLVTYARGVPVDSDGLPARETERVPLVDVNTGVPLTTPTGRPRVEVVTTGRLLVVDSIAVRLRRGGARAVGLWHDGKFVCGVTASPVAVLTSSRLRALVEVPAGQAAA